MKAFYDDGQVTIYCADILTAEQPRELTGTAACVVTSPPYNVGLAYDGGHDTLSWRQYWHLADAASVWISDALMTGGRAWVNTAVAVPELASGGDEPPDGKRRVLFGVGWANTLEVGGGLRLVDQVAWCSMRGSGTAWGSWQSPSAPNLRGDHELITVACKDQWERPAPHGFEDWHDQLGGWPELCSTVWHIGPEARAGHPAPFPLELAGRCIRLSTWPGETVLDLFAGSGSTLLAARNLGRRAIGVERSERYCELAARRLAQGALDFGGAA